VSSKRSHEGYYLIDNRVNEGVPAETMLSIGLPASAGQGLFESATFTCSHCEVVVVLNPDRTRERGYCRQCDHYICDGCTHKRDVLKERCYPWKARMADAIDEAIKKSTTGAEALIITP
jgi:hypothetical protein